MKACVHAVSATLDEKETVGVDYAHVSGTEPAVFREDLGCSLLVLVVAEEHIVTLD